MAVRILLTQLLQRAGQAVAQLLPFSLGYRFFLTVISDIRPQGVQRLRGATVECADRVHYQVSGDPGDQTTPVPRLVLVPQLGRQRAPGSQQHFLNQIVNFFWPYLVMAQILRRNVVSLW